LLSPPAACRAHHNTHTHTTHTHDTHTHTHTHTHTTHTGAPAPRRAPTTPAPRPCRRTSPHDLAEWPCTAARARACDVRVTWDVTRVTCVMSAGRCKGALQADWGQAHHTHAHTHARTTTTHARPPRTSHRRERHTRHTRRARIVTPCTRAARRQWADAPACHCWRLLLRLLLALPWRQPWRPGGACCSWPCALLAAPVVTAACHAAHALQWLTLPPPRVA
jgi:hypothetical protein